MSVCTRPCRLPPMMMVAFDTNIYMGADKDRLLIVKCLNCWVYANTPIRLLVPRVSSVMTSDGEKLSD